MSNDVDNGEEVFKIMVDENMTLAEDGETEK